MSDNHTADFAAHRVEADGNIILLKHFRLELIADMKRAAMDCRFDFASAKSPVDAILEKLLSICPNATAHELKDVLADAYNELYHQITERDCWQWRPIASELGAWGEIAKGSALRSRMESSQCRSGSEEASRAGGPINHLVVCRARSPRCSAAKQPDDM